MAFRLIPQQVVEKVLLTAMERYFDIETGRFIAVLRVRYEGSYKRLVVAYEEQGEEITAVTGSYRHEATSAGPHTTTEVDT